MMQPPHVDPILPHPYTPCDELAFGDMLRIIALALLSTFVLNILIATLLTLIGFGGDFTNNLIYSQCIGLSISLFLMPSHLFSRLRRLRRVLVPFALVFGSLFGYWLGGILCNSDTNLHREHLVPAVALGLFFGGVVTLISVLRERTLHLQAEVRQREMLHLEAEKRQIEAHLSLLQAQIEPHFLFNTLANVSALIDSQPALAKNLLEALNRYLRASLAHARASGGTLGNEIDMLRAYLEILGIRMAERLTYSIDVPDDLRALPLPPMLIQPLVENALKHGLEPLAEGGHIAISARSEEGRLHVEVRDTGRGFGNAPSEGVGLSNVRARLQALFDHAGKLVLSENIPRGVIASVEIPV